MSVSATGGISTIVASITIGLVCSSAMGAVASAGAHWDAPDRAARVAALIPGRNLSHFTPETLFVEWTKQQVARWTAAHGVEEAAAAHERYADAEPTDAELTADFPRHIRPFGRLKSGDIDKAKADAVMIGYCPFCGSHTLRFQFDPENPYGHATTTCCRTDLYATEQDWPDDYPLKPTATTRFAHLDDTWYEAPTTIHVGADQVEWELFIKAIFDEKRWMEQGSGLVKAYGARFEETADPLFAHKIAILLDQVADTYYGLPLANGNELCKGKDGGPLSRAEWEAVPRPAIFEVSYLGPWGRRDHSQGWLNMYGEHVWVEPFARVRHHPAFKEVSRQLYGDPEALDRKIMTRLMRELSLMFKSVFSQKLLHNYQEAIYMDMWMLGVLLGDPVLTSFAGPCQELTMYNHTYQDGLNGEGAPNYMSMPGGYYFPVLADSSGWLQYDPDFLDRNPFYGAARGEMQKLRTVRGMQLEYGDQHEHCLYPGFVTDPARAAANEQRPSRNWAGYGVGIIRVGGPGQRMEIALDYTRATLHNAQDALSMECWVDGVPVMRKGGYTCHWCNAQLDWSRPEFQALRAMDYPHEMIAGESGFEGWSWVYAHSPLCQNTATVDEVATGKGWGDDRGYGEVITYKGGEPAGAPGSGFQVLDVRDHYSWDRVDKDVSAFRRTVIGIEGPDDGRPYVLDIVQLDGGQRHALYNSAWAERADDRLPDAEGTVDDIAQLFFGETLPEDSPDYRNYRYLRKIERLGEQDTGYDLTWKTDYAAYGPRDADGRPFERPYPDDVGRVRLRFLGVPDADARTQLLRGKGPWLGWMRQPIAPGPDINGVVGFEDARDFLVEYRASEDADQPLHSLFVHVLEGYPEDEESAIDALVGITPAVVTGAARRVVALELRMAAGHTDVVIYQSDAGGIELPDGTQTDARYALIRRHADGTVAAIEASRGTYLRAGQVKATDSGDLSGTIVDVIGDLTGDRHSSALVIRPDNGWPQGDELAGRQLLVRVESPRRDACNEGYRVAAVTSMANGLLRVDLQDAAPFITSWHEVSVLPQDRPNVIRTWRPMSKHANSPWYGGMKLWFPEKERTYTINSVNELGGGYGGDTVELNEQVDLAADGIETGDWYVIYAVQPGQTVSVANQFGYPETSP